MGRRKKQPKNSTGFYGNLKIVLLSVLAAAAVIAVLTALFALVMSMVTVPAVVLSGVVVLQLMLAGFASGYLAAKSIRKNGLRVGVICGAVLSVLLFLLSGILFDSVGWQIITKMLVVTAAASIGGVLGVNSRKKYR
ncbi:MAG: TIGR04086 family membrane protein [Oscillospiraceae bacterium]|nr:TIGR04086 family membrane protein [Oscillospiraceae bacterium]